MMVLWGGTGGENQSIDSGDEDEGPINGDAKASNPWGECEDWPYLRVCERCLSFS